MKVYTKKAIWFFSLFLLISGFILQAGEKIDPILWKKALKLHDEAIVIDTHSDTPMALLAEEMDMGKKNNKGEVDFIRMKEGGLDAMFWAAFVSNSNDDKQPSRVALDLIDEIYQQVDRNPNLARIALSPTDIYEIHKEGKRAILIGMENGSPVENSLRFLRDFYRLGVRYITLTHNSNNAICDSSTTDKPKWNGLSPFGIEMVKEMNRIGMIVDISHVSDKTFWDVIKLSRAPVMASHSCVRAICDVPRNMTDEMIRALAQKGGVIQVNFYSSFLDPQYNKKFEETRKALEPEINKLRETYKNDRSAVWREMSKLFKEKGPSAPPIETLIDHIDHIVKLVGVDYVGLGSDFDGAGSFPIGLEDVSGYPLITYHLLKRGYKEADIKKILGGNFLRVFNSVIQVSKEITSSN